MKIHAGNIELAVAMLFNYRIHTIVPNVSWGLYLNHECDLLILDRENRFTEVEIKISISDLKADFNKGHNHDSRIISRLIYAFPIEILEKAYPLIPLHCGIITVETFESEGMPTTFKASWERQCKHRKYAEKPNNEIILKFMSLGCMRIWSLKAHNNKHKK